MTDPPRTPDGRYLIVEGRLGPRLWRASNPELPQRQRAALVQRLMAARRAVRTARGDAASLTAVRAEIDGCKRALGERGPVWWTDGAPDFNRRLVRNSPYRSWWEERTGNMDSEASPA